MGLISVLSKVSLILIILILIMPGFVVNPAQAAKPAHTPDPTKIVPTDGGQPGHPFTIIDTPAGRLVDGTKAVFKLGGTETVVDLKMNKPHKPAKGTVPDVPGGEYVVHFCQPDGTEISLGTFMIFGDEPSEPYITPTEGPVGTTFTIYDPLGRIKPGSLALFHLPNTDPATGVNADDITISSDGKYITGKVPPNLAAMDHWVSVQRTLGDPAYFEHLVFTIT
jgi:hypothetical protein